MGNGRRNDAGIGGLVKALVLLLVLFVAVKTGLWTAFFQWFGHAAADNITTGLPSSTGH